MYVVYNSSLGFSSGCLWSAQVGGYAHSAASSRGQSAALVKMAHSCRLRFPARPGASGSGRRSGRIRVTARLRSVDGTLRSPSALEPGYDAALQISATIADNLQTFRDVLGDASGSSSGEEDVFCGFGQFLANRGEYNPLRNPEATPTVEQRSRGCPPRAAVGSRLEEASCFPSLPRDSSYERAHGPTQSSSGSSYLGQGERGHPSTTRSKGMASSEQEKWTEKQTPLGSWQEQQQHGAETEFPKVGLMSKVARTKWLSGVKLMPCQSKPRDRRGRPASARYSKTEPANSNDHAPLVAHFLLEPEGAKQNTLKSHREQNVSKIKTPQNLKCWTSQTDGIPLDSEHHKAAMLTATLDYPQWRAQSSPRQHPLIRSGLASKRASTTVARQLLQRAKEGLQKKDRPQNKASGVQGSAVPIPADKCRGRGRRTQLRSIRQFTMPVVSTVSSRVIKMPKRFIDDETNFGDLHPCCKMLRLESTPIMPVSSPSGTMGVSCTDPLPMSTSPAKSVVAGLVEATPHPLNDSSKNLNDPQSSEVMAALSSMSQRGKGASLVHTLQQPFALTKPEHCSVMKSDHKGRRGQGARRGSLVDIYQSSLQAGYHRSSSMPSSSSPAITGKHPPNFAWVMPHHIAPFMPVLPVNSPVREGRRSILRQPTFLWTSLSHSERQGFSSAKYAREGLIRRPVFDNFHPPPLTAEDVGLPSPAGGISVSMGGRTFGAVNRFLPPLPPHSHSQSPPWPRPVLRKLRPLLRAPCFTPSEAHSRIYESVTLPAPVRLPALPRAPTAVDRNVRSLGRRTLRSQPRMSSHAMTTRSSRFGTQTGDVSSLLPPLKGSVSTSLTRIAFNSASDSTFASFSTVPVSHTLESFGGTVSTCSQVSLFASTLLPVESGKSTGKNDKEASALLGSPPEEKEQERKKGGEQIEEKEMDRRKKGVSEVKGATQDAITHAALSSFRLEGQKIEESFVSPSPAKPLSSTETVTADNGSQGGPAPRQSSLSEEGRVAENNSKVAVAGDMERVSRLQQTTSSEPAHGQVLGPPLSSPLAQTESKPGASQRVAGLLKKAGAQLCKIKRRQDLRGEEPTEQGLEKSDSPEVPVRGPRIKHVCRRAAAALGQRRAVFPDDMPTLSALPWGERQSILSSAGNKGKLWNSMEAWQSSYTAKQVTKHRTPSEAPSRRGRRCGQCPGCAVREDCGTCANCLDKPKFGGRNIKKQCCRVRKCQNLQSMTSVMLDQSEGKVKKDKKRGKKSGKKGTHRSGSVSTIKSLKLVPGPLQKEPSCRRSRTPPYKSFSVLVPSPSLLDLTDPPADPNPSAAEDPLRPAVPSVATAQRERRLNSPLTMSSGGLSLSPQGQHKPCPPSQSLPPSGQQKPCPPSQSLPPTGQQKPCPPSQSLPPSGQQKRCPSTQSLPPSGQQKICPGLMSDIQEKQNRLHTRNPVTSSSSTDSNDKMKKGNCPLFFMAKQKPKEKLRPMTLQAQTTPLNSLTPPFEGDHGKRGSHSEGKDLRDFGSNVNHVWEMGGLGILTAAHSGPRFLCFLCASAGKVEFVFCQVCCEPFHLFCLEEVERPQQQQLKNWCCRLCQTCSLCHRQQLSPRPLLECVKCHDHYHPECLEPHHPTRPNKTKIWVCPRCVHCGRCGYSMPGPSGEACRSFDYSMCQRCVKESLKDECCLLCEKQCDEDCNDGVFESKMIQCGRCGHQVHAKCENLSDEMYEILCSQLEGIAYTCIRCAVSNPVNWRSSLQSALQSSIRRVLSALLDSPTSRHLLYHSQSAMKAPDLNLEPEESLPLSCSAEGPGPPILAESLAVPLDLMSVKRKMETGQYSSVMEFSDDVVRIIQAAMRANGGDPEKMKADCVVKSFFIKLMDREFPWFKVKESKFWEVKKVSSSCGLASSAMLPRLDHSYAQKWERNRITPVEEVVGAPQTSVCHTEDTEVLTQSDMSDDRQCVLCLLYGDVDANEGGRLLYIGWYEWAHVNCVLWSTEVFEDEDGTLKNVHMAVVRGKQEYCELCQRPGATVGCCIPSCSSNFHFMCARRQHCAFLEDRQVYCQHHSGLVKGQNLSESEFEVMRRILVDPEGISLRTNYCCGLKSEDIRVMIGSMTVDCLGMLKQLSECEGKLFPIGYKCSRVYWSTADAHRRSLYTCKILTRPPLFVEHESKSTAKPKESQTLSSSHFSDSGDLSSSAPEEIIVGLPRSTLSPPLLPVASQDLWPKVPKKQKMSSVEDQNCKIGPPNPKDQSKILVVKVDGTQNSTSSLVKTETLTCARALPAPVALVRTSKLKKTDCRMEEARARNRDTNTSAAFGTKTKSSSKLRIVKRGFQVEKKTSKLRVSTALMPTNVTSSGRKPSIPSSDTTTVFHTSAKQDILRSSKSQLFPSTSMGSEKSELNSQQSSLDGSFTHENKGSAINNCDSVVLSKRRYPHRSTRARANILFGHKPFYNVGSYREKGVPFYHRKNDTSSLRDTNSKPSAKGQVDAMDCVSSSSSGESGEEEESKMNINTETHYYNFTRTTVSSDTGALSTGEIELCSIKESQAKTMRKGREKKPTKEGAVLTGCPNHLRITQLDGIDDGSESDTSVSTSSIPKNNSNRRKVKECQIYATKTDSGKGVENSTGTRENSSGSAHESRRNRREACLPSEVQSSISTDLLSIGSDDCSNILPSDIMEFVLNTPSLQALGQQEASSSELVCLEEGFGLQADQGKDIGLFEDFAQPVSVESGTRVSGEEQYNLPLVLPSDLSVLTTTCPSVNEPKHGALILKHNIASTSPRDLTVWKGIVKQRGGTEGSAEDQHSGNRTEDLTVKEGEPKPLTKGLMEANNMAFPPLSQAVEPESKDLKKTSEMSSSPSMPLQMQKTTPVPMEIQDPVQAASIAAHLTPSQENIIVLNQPLQPLYLVHSLPNGGTQKIQIVAPVSTTGGIDANLSALNSMTGKLETTAGLNTGITGTQAMFSPTLNGAVLQAFTESKQTNLQPGLSHTSGFLPGVQSQNSNIMGTVSGFDMTLVSSASSPSSMVLTSGHGTKRPISRLQPRKIKKLSRSSNKLNLAPSDVRSSRTLVNVLPSQMAPGLVQLGTLTTAASTSHQKVSRLVKWPKPGYVYLEPATAVLSQGMSLSSGQPSCIGQENPTPLLPCTVSGLNVVSVPGRAHSSIVGPDPLNTHEPQIVLQSGTSQFISPLASHSQAPMTNSICVLSAHQVLGINQFTDHENMSCLEHQSVAQVELDKPQNLNASAATLGSISVEPNLKSHGQNRNLMVFPSQNHQDSDQHQGRNKAAVNSTSETEKGEQKCSTEKASGKKHNSCQEKESADIACSLSPSTCDKTVSLEPVHTEEKTTTKSVTDEVESSEKCEVKVPPDPKTEEGWLSAPLVSISDGVRHRKAVLQCEKSAKGVIFEIYSDDGFYLCSESIDEAWRYLTDKVQQTRCKAGLKKLSFEGVDGLRMLGVVHSTVLFLLEHLHGIQRFGSHRFKFCKSNSADKPSVNPQGSARTRLYHKCSYAPTDHCGRKSSTWLVFNTSRFLESKRRLPPEYKPCSEIEEAVQLTSGWSSLYSLDLFCTKDIDTGEMVIMNFDSVVHFILTSKLKK